MPLAGFFLCSMVTLAHALPEQRVHRPQSAAGACGPCLFRGRFVHQAGDHIQHLAIVLHPGPAGVPAVACAVDFLAIVQLAADRGVPLGGAGLRPQVHVLLGRNPVVAVLEDDDPAADGTDPVGVGGLHRGPKSAVRYWLTA